MPLYNSNQPLRRGGFTFLELIVALAVASITVAALVGLFRAALTATRFALRQTSVLSNIRKAMVSDGPHLGVIWGIQDSTAAVSVSANSINLILPGDVPLDYSLAGDTLKQVQAGATYYQATGLSLMSVNYYHIDSNGLIQVSTSASQAQYVTTSFTLKGKLMRDATYYLYSGTWIRNK